MTHMYKLPLKVADYDIESFINEADYHCLAVCSGSNHKERAAFIARAVNSHDALLAACESALYVLKNTYNRLTEITILEAAIKAAKGE